MAEYIERDVAVKTAMALFAPVNTATQAVIESSLRSKFNSIPAADVAPVVHGKWVDSHGNPVAFDKRDNRCPDESCYCSECGDWLTASDEYSCVGNYCPNCGARMNGDEEHDPVVDEIMQEEDRAREREMQSMWL